MMRTANVRPGARGARPRRDAELVLQLGQRGGVKRLRATARQPAGGGEPGAMADRYALDRPARERHLEPGEPSRRRLAHGALPGWRRTQHMSGETHTDGQPLQGRLRPGPAVVPSRLKPGTPR